MIRSIIETKNFSKALDSFLKKRQLLQSDYKEFKKELSANPERGDLIIGTGGVRKIRLKSSSKGKSGGFRVCYYYLHQDEEIYLMLIYGKNEQENLTTEEKKSLKAFVNVIKGTQ